MPWTTPKHFARMPKTVIMDFHYSATSTLVAGAQAILMNPTNLAVRSSTEADGFTYFRIKKLKFRFIPNGLPTGNSAIGVVSGVPNTLPSTYAQVSELLDSTVHASASTYPLETNWTRWVSVRKEVLKGPIEWYNTFAGSFAQEFDVPCTMCLAGTGTDVLLYEIFFTLEFKDPVATANTPAAVALRTQARKLVQESIQENEKRRILALLSAPVQGGTTLSSGVIGK